MSMENNEKIAEEIAVVIHNDLPSMRARTKEAIIKALDAKDAVIAELESRLAAAEKERDALAKQVSVVQIELIEKLEQERDAALADVQRLEAALKLVAVPELQDRFTAQQIAKHALRMEPIQP